MATSTVLILLCATGFAMPAGDLRDAVDQVRAAMPVASGPHYVARFELPFDRQREPEGSRAGTRDLPPAVLAVDNSAAPPAPEPAATGKQLAVADPAKTGPIAATAQRARVAGVIPLNYSLAGGARAGDAIEVDKPVSFAGADAGRIPLRIDGNARVYALGSRLAEIIARQSGEAFVPKGLERDFVSLDRLRALGIGVRYDAIRDRLMVDPSGG